METTEAASVAKETAGVIAPPPLIYLAFLGLGFGLDYAWPVALLSQATQYAIGAACIAVAAFGVTLVLRRFRKAGTNIETHKPTKALVTDGPFRLSRNPVYVSLSIFYAGIAIAADNLWALGLLIPILGLMRFGVIAREERYLERKFGAAYLAYKSSVRRWI